MLRSAATTATVLTALAALSLIGRAPADPTERMFPTYPWVDRTPAQAIQTVRDFEHNERLVVNCVAAPPAIANPHDVVGGFYRLTADGHNYLIGKRCRIIHRTMQNDPIAPPAGARYMPRQLGASQRSQDIGAQEYSLPVTQDEAETIATQFMLANFDNPSNAVLADTSCSFIDGSPATFFFRYVQEAGNGFLGPANCGVIIDAATGDIVDWGDAEYALTVSTIPALSGDQAIADAAQAIQYLSDGGVPTVTDSIVGQPDALGQESLEYRIQLPGYANGDMNDDEMWIVVVDANTGAILQLDEESSLSDGPTRKKASSGEMLAVARTIQAPFPRMPGRSIPMTVGGAKTHLSLPVLLIDGQPYVPAAYIAAASASRAWVRRDDSILVHTSNRSIAFRPNTTSYTVDSSRCMLNSAPIEAGNCVYVPLQLANVIAPGRFIYRPKSQTLDCRPGPL
jgi:hypothetical protein